MWPTGSGGTDSLRITDFISVPNPGHLALRPSGACPGGIVDTKYQQLDVATGDFDGDGLDDVVAAYSLPTADTWIQRALLVVPEVRSGPLDWETAVTDTQGHVVIARTSSRSPSNIRLATGNFFDDDLKQQFVLGTRVQANFHGTLGAGDRFGEAVAGIGDVDHDGVDDLAVGAPMSDDGGAECGAIWILFMRSDGTVRWQQKISATQGGFTGPLVAGDRFGYSVALVDHDLNGDAVIAVGAPNDDDGGTDQGAVWVIHLNDDGTVKSQLKISATSGGSPGPLDPYDYFGGQVASLGDLDGNGHGDLAVSAAYDDDGGLDRGAAWVLFLGGSGVDSTRKISSATVGFLDRGLGNSDVFGVGIACHPDFDGAGTRVLAVGAPYDDDGGTDRGAVWLMVLHADGSVDSLAKLSHNTNGFGALVNGDRLGFSVCAVPDLDGDGIGDLAVGAPYDDDGGTDRGAVYLLSMRADGTVEFSQQISANEGGFGGSLGNSDLFGRSIACPGNLGGDPKVDLVVGAPGSDKGGTDTGIAWFVFLGSGTTVVDDEMQNGAWRDGMLQLQLMQLDNSRRPTLLASTFGQHQADSDSLKESQRFDVATGDFDGDGIDEIAVGGVRATSDNHMEVFVTVYAYEAGALVEKATSSYGDVAQELSSWGEGSYFDHVAIATGNLRATSLTDQILFSWQDRWENWHLHNCGFLNLEKQRELDYRLTTYLVTLEAHSPATGWEISGWETDKISDLREDDLHYGNCDGNPNNGYDRHDTGASLGLAAGDLTGDGVDEVVWAAIDNVRVYQVGDDSKLAERASVTRPYEVSSLSAWNDPARRVVAIANLDTGFVATSWTPEIVVQDWQGTAQDHKIRVFRVNLDEGRVASLSRADSLVAPWVDKGGDIALVCGDFDGDGLRLGAPTSHDVTNIIQPQIILGAPPTHYTWLHGEEVDANDCYPGWTCSDFQASYTKEATVGLAVNTELKSDWGLSLGLQRSLDVKIPQVGSAKLEQSLTATYGQNFSRTRASEKTFRSTITVNTGGGDRVLADKADYRIWEYPVYGPGRELLGHLSVVEPDTVGAERQWYTLDGWLKAGGGITHEPGNALSYRAEVPTTADSLGVMWKSYADWIPVATPGTALVGTEAVMVPSGSFTFTQTDRTTDEQQNGWRAGLEVGSKVTLEVQDPLEIVKASASVDVKGHYNLEQLRTHKITVGEQIDILANLGWLATLPNGGKESPYTVKPFLYRARSGALVLDYAVRPDTLGTWWHTEYQVVPDLTFILPRFYWPEKGIPINDPTTKYQSPDVRVSPLAATVGDTVAVQLTVRNFSLRSQDAPVAFRLYAGDPDDGGQPLTDLGGAEVFWTTDGVAARGMTRITVECRAPNASGVTRIYAQLDPGDVVPEVHEENNKGYAELVVIGGTVDVPAQVVGVPFRLEQSVPNPFRSATKIAFGLPAKTQVKLNVYDIAGRLITTLVDAELAPGRHEVRWDGRGRDGSAVRPGIYLYRIKAGIHGETRRIVRLN